MKFNFPIKLLLGLGVLSIAGFVAFPSAAEIRRGTWSGKLSKTSDVHRPGQRSGANSAEENHGTALVPRLRDRAAKRESIGGSAEAMAAAGAVDGRQADARRARKASAEISATGETGIPDQLESREVDGNVSWAAVDSGMPGHSLTAGSEKAVVTAYQPVPGSGGVALAIEVSEADSSLGEGEVSSGGSWTAGLSYEQQLFRTKWGWHAYDQTLKVLNEERSQSK